jgi:hypothetical protein
MQAWLRGFGRLSAFVSRGTLVRFALIPSTIQLLARLAGLLRQEACVQRG